MNAPTFSRLFSFSVNLFVVHGGNVLVAEKGFRGDKQRYIEFKAYCDEYDFHFYIMDKDGKRRQMDPSDLIKN